MTIKLSSLKSDLELEEKGEWQDYPDWPGVRFEVSSINKPAYVVERDLMMQRLARKHGRKVPPNVLTVEFGRLYHKHLLHNWDGLDEAYTPELAGQIMTNPEYREVIKAVEYCAGQVGRVDAEFLEEAGKNSGLPSGGERKAEAKAAG